MSINKLFVFVLVFLCSSLNAEELQEFSIINKDWTWIAKTDYKTGEDWIPQSLCGRNFWYLAGAEMHNYKGVSEETFIEEAGFMNRYCGMGMISPGSAGLFSDEEITLRRIAIREIEVYAYEKKTNFASNATISTYDTKSKKFCYEEKINDGDKRNNASSYSSAVSYLNNQAGVIELNWKEKIEISRIIIFHGYQQNPHINRLSYITMDFFLQHWDGEKWVNIQNTDTHYNTKGVTEYTFPNIKTNKLRMVIKKRGYPVVSLRYLPKKIIENIHEGKPYILTVGHRIAWSFLAEGEDAFQCFLKTAVDYDSLNILPDKDNFLGFTFGEWDSDFIRRWFTIQNDVQRKQNGFKELGWHYPSIESRQEAYDLIINKLLKILINTYFSKVVGFCGGTLFQHYVLESGATASLSECGSAPKSRQMVQMFARSASRQYQKPWGYYEAYFWNDGKADGIVNFFMEENVKCGDGYAGPDCGIPVSLGRRDLYLAYFCGASYFTLESEPEAFFKRAPYKKDTYELSPHGKVIKEIMEFVKKNPDRGVQYTPVLLLLDYRHGYYTPVSKNWALLPRTDSDVMINSFFHTIIRWGNDKDLFRQRAWNSPYCDMFDVMLANPPSGIITPRQLKQYKAVFLLGDIDISNELAENLKNYVKNGGTFILNASQKCPFWDREFLGAEISDQLKTGKEFDYYKITPSTAIPLILNENKDVLLSGNIYGKGRVIISAPAYLMSKTRKPDYLCRLVDTVLGRIQKECIPFKITGNVSFQVNRTNDGWLLILLNNEGVTKALCGPEILDKTKGADVKISLEFSAVKCRDILSDTEIQLYNTESEQYIKLDISAGDIKVIHIKEGDSINKNEG